MDINVGLELEDLCCCCGDSSNGCCSDLKDPNYLLQNMDMEDTLNMTTTAKITNYPDISKVISSMPLETMDAEVLIDVKLPADWEICNNVEVEMPVLEPEGLLHDQLKVGANNNTRSNSTSSDDSGMDIDDIDENEPEPPPPTLIEWYLYPTVAERERTLPPIQLFSMPGTTEWVLDQIKKGKAAIRFRGSETRGYLSGPPAPTPSEYICASCQKKVPL